MLHPSMTDLLEKVDNRYLPVDLAAKVVGRYQSEAETESPLESPYRDRGESLD